MRLWRTDDSTRKGEFDATAAPHDLRFQEKLDERGNHEFLFAHRAIFCEGKDDVLAVRIGLEKLSVELDSLGVSIIDAGGASSLPHYANIASTLGIPWCALTDEDRQSDGSIKPMTEEVRKRLAKILTAADVMPLWKVSLGNCLGVAHGRELEYLRTSVEPKPLADLEKNNPDYLAVCREVRDWIGAK